MKENNIYIKRCFDLAKRAWGKVSPNPMVGAVLVNNNRIIGEGWHEQYGGPHAEVNAVNSVQKCDTHLIKDSTLYVSLEPCNFYGKTPPCSELILKEGIKKLVVSNIDHTPGLGGKSLDFLRSKGVTIEYGILEKEGQALSQYRNTYVDKLRPFIQLKYAVSSDGFIGESNNRIKISNELSKRFVHKLRVKADAILVGANTALTDNPMLNSRNWPGESPLKVLIDPNLKVPLTNNIYSDTAPLKVINKSLKKKEGHIEWLCPEAGEDLLAFLLNDLYKDGIGILLVEGGSYTIQQFLNKFLYDEIYVIRTEKKLTNGIKEPVLIDKLNEVLELKDNIIEHFTAT